MNQAKPEKGRCPVEATLALINGKWKLLILKALSQGPVRYLQLERTVERISAKVLTQQLREMEADGLISRTIYPEIPPRVEYALTEMGVSIFTIFGEMRRWGLLQQDQLGTVCRQCQNCRPVPVETKAEANAASA
ncbi:MAG: helix-turn-helix transcriptional regulator [Erysipelotrichaceae bacterium]|jgi:DNA-binding HxlR family transcriptional regulator|nr:helix-turn-helix transcriptional regulator [Erysipelotrichaceae bacterium]